MKDDNPDYEGLGPLGKSTGSLGPPIRRSRLALGYEMSLNVETHQCMIYYV
jgi:hypothetical protein